MTLAELRLHAMRQQQLQNRVDAVVRVTMHGQWPKNNQRRLFSRGRGPVGRVVADLPGNYIEVEFSAKDILEALQEVREP